MSPLSFLEQIANWSSISTPHTTIVSLIFSRHPLDETTKDAIVHIDNFDNKNQLLTAVYLNNDEPTEVSERHLDKETPMPQISDNLKNQFIDFLKTETICLSPKTIN